MNGTEPISSQPAGEQADAAPRSGVARRQHQRVADPPVAVSGEWASVRDISPGGISLEQAELLALGERYRMVVTDVFRSDAAALDAEVVWCRDGWVGLRWIELDEAGKQWLEEHCREWQENSVLAQLAQCLTETNDAPDTNDRAAQIVREVIESHSRQSGRVLAQELAPEPEPEPEPAVTPSSTDFGPLPGAGELGIYEVLTPEETESWWERAKRRLPWMTASR